MRCKTEQYNNYTVIKLNMIRSDNEQYRTTIHLVILGNSLKLIFKYFTRIKIKRTWLDIPEDNILIEDNIGITLAV